MWKNLRMAKMFTKPSFPGDLTMNLEVESRLMGVSQLPGNGSTPVPTLQPVPHGDAFENLFPALLECFAIIFAGYFAG